MAFIWPFSIFQDLAFFEAAYGQIWPFLFLWTWQPWSMHTYNVIKSLLKIHFRGNHYKQLSFYKTRFNSCCRARDPLLLRCNWHRNFPCFLSSNSRLYYCHIDRTGVNFTNLFWTRKLDHINKGLIQIICDTKAQFTHNNFAHNIEILR